MCRFTFTAEREADTERFARALAGVIPDGTLVVLSGTLGAGKTTLVRAFAASVGVPSEDVTSPTYVLCQHYRGERIIAHVDLYRVHTTDEVWELAWDELLESGSLVFVEWGERFPSCLPSDYLQIHIKLSGNDARQFEVQFVGERQGPWWDELMSSL